MRKKQGNLCVIQLGGTISCTKNNPTAEFYDPTHTSLNKLIDKVSRDNSLKIDTYSPFSLISHEIAMNKLIELGQFVQRLLDSNQYNGIIITMGTNALEDVAFFISVVIKTSTPVVFTGALYPQNSLSFDGERNLYNAIQIALSEKARDLGVLVTFCDYVVSARDAVKIPAGLLTNFSNGSSIVGYVGGSEFILRAKPIINQTDIPGFHLEGLNTSIKIAVFYAHLGMDETVINSLVESNVDGIISAGFGKGYQPQNVTCCLKKAVQRGIVVVRCARSDLGFSGEDPKYDLENGFIKSSGMPANKLAILLFIVLSFTKEISQLKAILGG